MSNTFSATVQAWVSICEKRLAAVQKEASQRVIAEAQKPVAQGGRMRVDTGFLRASGKASTTAMPRLDQSRGGQASFNYSESEIALVIAGAELGQTIYFGYTAEYAAAREYGSRGQAPDAFVRSAAQKWPAIVEQVTNEVRVRIRR